jgi:hypothetical protein
MVAANAKYQTGDFLNEVNQAVASNQPEKLMGILSRKIGQYAANNKKNLIAAVQRGGIDVQQNISDQALFSVIANNIYKGNKRLINSVVYEILPAENLNDSGHSDSELNHSPSNNTGPTNTTIPDSRYFSPSNCIGSGAQLIIGRLAKHTRIYSVGGIVRASHQVMILAHTDTCPFSNVTSPSIVTGRTPSYRRGGL